ncbi:MAG: 50S ribosomal protein L6 [Nanoarchaeota archaeon]|nr:50S ribosomal protein L6 [Nanoarchaeota archaeon]
MKTKITEQIEIPSSVECEYKDKILICKKGSLELKRKIAIPKVKISLKDGNIIFHSEKATKIEKKSIVSFIYHIKNMFQGLDKKFAYKLESCNVHFPMTLKVEGSRLIINNFLGEKTPRHANILPNVDVQIKGNLITISSHEKESAGQTAANFEKSTKVTNRDRRIFQDGIYITEKPGEGE